MATLTKHRTARKTSPGTFYPLGATLSAEGVNFALYSQHASEVYLLLFDEPSGEPTDVIRLRHRTRFVWHVFVQGLRPGQLYGYRVLGEARPEQGLRFNGHKLLMDPYAKALTGKFANKDNLLLAYDAQSPARDLSSDARENARFVPKSIVIDDSFDWQGDRPPEVPSERLILYEAHVKGFTAHPSSKVRNPGTYLGFAEKIPHLRSLGVNAVELLPVHEFYVEDFLAERGLTNYWGYNSIGFFAPESSYSSGSSAGCQVQEFKTLVRELHKAGILVLMDVVYNHTGEGNEFGPTIHLRGIDNPTYYCLTGPANEPARHYMNYSGCGNSLNANHAPVLRLVMDSLRYWVKVMHVDGFRFDLASVLGREGGGYQKTASFFDAVAQDPVLNRVHLIAEPWDVGTYQVGNFPVDWSEWNGRFRDTVRRFVKGDGGVLAELGWRVSGSADLYGEDGRHPYHSVNFVTCHDGFTLWDLVSYNQKHNEANGEGNADGTNENHSWNCGEEGETDDPEVLELRRRLAKNHVCMLLFSCGTPMLLGGDEFLRTQGGNNNAYCQDNELCWHDWRAAAKNSDFTDFVRKAIAFRKRVSVLNRTHFLTGEDRDLDAIPDVSWFGKDLQPPVWDDPEGRTLCCMLDAGEGGEEEGDYQLFFILNSSHRDVQVQLPPPAGRWRRVVDTALPAGQDFLEPGREAVVKGSVYRAVARSVVVLTRLPA
jgi:glycogen operon protein